MQNKQIKIGFFGTPKYAAMVLDKLYSAGFIISFVVTAPDKPRGRGMKMSPSEAKESALAKKVPVFEPSKDDLVSTTFADKLRDFGTDVFVVIAYGKIIPEQIINIPKHKTLNIHGSLLPKYRGPSPIESAILSDDRETGVTIMLIDKEMDHGPVVAIEKVNTDKWPITKEELGNKIVEKGADLLIKILPDWVSGKIEAKEQDHSKATYTKKITKEDALIDLSDDAHKNLLKINAFFPAPGAYFIKDGKRIKITRAKVVDNKLIIEKVIPESKSETDWKN